VLDIDYPDGMTPGDVVRAYLKLFETQDAAGLDALMAEDVQAWGANQHVTGRDVPAGAIAGTPGLSNCRLEILEFYEAGDRVTVYFRTTYRHDASGRDIQQTGLKMYEVRDGRITRFWGETDLWGLLRAVGKVPERADFS
jgi:ketosteroid isomerase-like protein